MFEALNAVLSGSSRGLVRAIDQFGDAADEAGDEALTAAAQTEAFEGQAEDIAQAAAGALPPTRVLASQVDEVGDEATDAASDIGVFGASVGGAGTAATGATLPLTALQSRFDEVGDEAVDATLSTAALTPALSAASASASSGAASSTALSTALSGVSVSASASAGSLIAFTAAAAGAVAVALALVEAAIGVAAALGGVAVAATGGAAALAGLFVGGLLPLAEEIKQTSEDVETIFGGLAKIFERVGQQAAAALAPLRGVEGFQDLAINALNGAVELLALGAQTAASLADTLQPIARRIGAVFDAVAPQVFGELARSVRTLAPLVEDALVGTLRAVPGVIRTLTAAAQDLAPDLRALGANLAEFAPQLVAFTVDVARVVVPALNALLELATDINQVLVPLADLAADALLAAADGAAAFGAELQALSPVSGNIASLARQAVRVADAFAMAAHNAGELFTAKRALSGSPTAIADVVENGLELETELPDRSGLFRGAGPGAAAPVEQPSGTPDVTVESVVAPSGASDREVGRRVGREVEKALREKRRDQRGGTSG